MYLREHRNKQKMGKAKYPLALMVIILLGRISFSSLQTSNNWVIQPDDSGGGATRLILAAIAYLLAFFTSFLRLTNIFQLMGRTWPFLLFILFAALSASWAIRPASAITYSVHMVGLFLIAMATAFSCNNDVSKLYRGVHLACMAAIFLSIIVAVFYPSKGIVYLGNVTGEIITPRWRGITPSPNVLGLVCTASVWSGITWFYSSKSFFTRVFTFVTVIISFAIVAKGAISVTSMFSCIILFFLTIVLSKKGTLGKLRFGYTASVLLCVVLLVLALFSVGMIILYVGRDFTFSGRTYIWDIGLDMLAQKLPLGWSFDERASIYAVLPPTMVGFSSFHNGFLEAFVQGGVIGGSIVLLTFIFFLRSTIRVRKIDPALAAASFLCFCSLVVTNLMESTILKIFDPMWSLMICLWCMNEYKLLMAQGDETNQSAEYGQLGPVDTNRIVS